MTRLQLTLLSIVSAISTVAVLAGGAFSADGGPALSAAALGGPVTVTAALPAAAAPVSDTTSTDTPSAAADATTDTTSSDAAASSDVAPVSSAPCGRSCCAR